MSSRLSGFVSNDALRRVPLYADLLRDQAVLPAAFDPVPSGAVDSPEFTPLKVLVIERFGKLFDIVGSV